MKWTALAHGALCEALLDKRADGEAMLAELGEGWRRMRTIASGEWVAAAGHAAVRLGEDAAALLRDALADAPHHTAWSRAALASLEGTLASARGDYTAAAMLHLKAAERYSGVGSATDRALALGGAVRALHAAADARAADARALAARDEVAQFADRNRIVTSL
jgi:ATP/maltotriose-dependent transcriptional regulator MalT